MEKCESWQFGIECPLEQLGIPGIADPKPFPDGHKKENNVEGMLRPKLYEFIRDTLKKDSSGFARMLDVSPATVTQWLYTERMPRASVLARMPSTLELSYEEILKLFESQRPA